jgi:transcriptional regulator with XRE-family HTH domain
MYTNKLLEAYKEQMRYVQYKQIAHDLGISPQMLTDIRKGRNFLKENQVLMLAEAIGEDKEKALVGLAMDKAKTYEAQTLWHSIGKKFNGLGLSTITMSCMAFALTILEQAKCALSLLCSIGLKN